MKLNLQIELPDSEDDLDRALAIGAGTILAAAALKPAARLLGPCLFALAAAGLILRGCGVDKQTIARARARYRRQPEDPVVKASQNAGDPDESPIEPSLV